MLQAQVAGLERCDVTPVVTRESCHDSSHACLFIPKIQIAVHLTMTTQQPINYEFHKKSIIF